MTEDSIEVVHLFNQEGQPYGSASLCCQRCGLMLVSNPGHDLTNHYFVDAAKDWYNHEKRCLQ